MYQIENPFGLLDYINISHRFLGYKRLIITWICEI